MVTTASNFLVQSEFEYTFQQVNISDLEASYKIYVAVKSWSQENTSRYEVRFQLTDI